MFIDKLAPASGMRAATKLMTRDLPSYIPDLGLGLAAAAVAGGLWALQGGMRGQPSSTSPIRVPPVVFYIVWPAIYISLAALFRRCSPLARAAILAYVLLSFAWILVSPRSRSAGFLIIAAMLWAAAAIAVVCRNPLIALPLAWTITALVLSATGSPR
jgi:hypothetical protein